VSLVWKLLRQHISVPQLAGFFLANLVGMLIVLLGFQFYRDVLPVFTAEDSFMKSDFIIISKKIGAANALSSRGNSFSRDEVNEIEEQPFVTKTGQFTRAEYKLDASMGVGGQSLLNSEFFLESVPDDFIDVPLTDWSYKEGGREVPVIIPRSYINMYNFGFAQSHGLPKISDGVLGMVDLRIVIRGAGGQRDEFRGRVVGLSGRLNSILVPQSFMVWSNAQYAPNAESEPTRLLVQVDNPTDERIHKFLERRSYDTEDDRLDAERTVGFLRLVVVLVMAIGLVIAVLSFYILMLSIYLLVEKNASKLENLLLMGYSPRQVARPYQLLAIGLNAVVLAAALGGLWFVRAYYMGRLADFFPQVSGGSFMPAVCLGVALFVFVSLLNLLTIGRKMVLIWRRKE